MGLTKSPKLHKIISFYLNCPYMARRGKRGGPKKAAGGNGRDPDQSQSFDARVGRGQPPFASFMATSSRRKLKVSASREKIRDGQDAHSLKGMLRQEAAFLERQLDQSRGRRVNHVRKKVRALIDEIGGLIDGLDGDIRDSETQAELCASVEQAISGSIGAIKADSTDTSRDIRRALRDVQGFIERQYELRPKKDVQEGGADDTHDEDTDPNIDLGGAPDLNPDLDPDDVEDAPEAEFPRVEFIEALTGSEGARLNDLIHALYDDSHVGFSEVITIEHVQAIFKNYDDLKRRIRASVNVISNGAAEFSLIQMRDTALQAIRGFEPNTDKLPNVFAQLFSDAVVEPIVEYLELVESPDDMRVVFPASVRIDAAMIQNAFRPGPADLQSERDLEKYPWGEQEQGYFDEILEQRQLKIAELTEAASAPVIDPAPMSQIAQYLNEKFHGGVAVRTVEALKLMDTSEKDPFLRARQPELSDAEQGLLSLAIEDLFESHHELSDTSLMLAYLAGEEGSPLLAEWVTGLNDTHHGGNSVRTPNVLLQGLPPVVNAFFASRLDDNDDDDSEGPDKGQGVPSELRVEINALLVRVNEMFAELVDPETGKLKKSSLQLKFFNALASVLDADRYPHWGRGRLMVFKGLLEGFIDSFTVSKPNSEGKKSLVRAKEIDTKLVDLLIESTNHLSSLTLPNAGAFNDIMDYVQRLDLSDDALREELEHLQETVGTEPADLQHDYDMTFPRVVRLREQIAEHGDDVPQAIQNSLERWEGKLVRIETQQASLRAAQQQIENLRVQRAALAKRRAAFMEELKAVHERFNKMPPVATIEPTET
jgi:hypothetical protein